MRDIIKVSVVLATVGCLKIFDSIYVMTGGGPYNLTSTIALQLYKESFFNQQFGYGSAIAALLTVICIVTFSVMNKLLTREAVEY
jgi:raffinose/stachyose/melibiose transport system permease protein